MPLTKVTNKHLLPVGEKPMMYYPIEKLTSAGIEEILIVTGVEHMGDVVGLLGSGKDFGCRFTYKVQDEAGGIAQALGLCEGFVGDRRCCVVLGDNIFTHPISQFLKKFMESCDGDAQVLLKKVPRPERFGVADVEKGVITRIVEKPDEPTSDLAVTGVYFYNPHVFSIIKGLKPSGRGELEITDVNNWYVQRKRMLYSVLPGEWTDAGTFPSLARANEVLEGDR